MKRQIQSITIPVTDLEASLLWYSKLLNCDPIGNTFSLTAGPMLSLQALPNIPVIAELNMKTLNTESAFRHVCELSINATEPVESHGVRWFQFHDPDGNMISINDGIEQALYPDNRSTIIKVGVYCMYVKTIATTNSIYQLLGGFTPLHDYEYEEKRYLEYDNLFCLIENPSFEPLPYCSVLFASSDIEEDRRRLIESGVPTEPLKEHAGIYFNDPDGNLIGLVQQ